MFQWISLKALLNVHGQTVLLVVVDCFSQYAYFLPLHHPVESMANEFFFNLVHLHRVLVSIVSDRDVIFTSNV